MVHHPANDLAQVQDLSSEEAPHHKHVNQEVNINAKCLNSINTTSPVNMSWTYDTSDSSGSSEVVTQFQSLGITNGLRQNL